jgi:hypothetical protein
MHAVADLRFELGVERHPTVVELDLIAQAELLKQKKSGFPMILQKKAAHNLTTEAVRGDRNIIHEANRVFGSID